MDRVELSGSKVVILLSGGLDSAVMLAYVKQFASEVWPLTFLYGQRNVAEITAAQNIAAYFGVGQALTFIHLKDVFSKLAPSALVSTGSRDLSLKTESPQGEKSFVPYRNLIFLTFAAAYAHKVGAGTICIGSQESDVHPDSKQQFRDSLQHTLFAAIDNDVPRIETPLAKYSKVDIIKLGAELKVPFDETISCYAPILTNPCNECQACKKRAAAFKEAALEVKA